MPKRVFISFPIEDEMSYTFLVGQARNENSPFEFVDMGVKEPWSDSWRARCRTRIKGCDGMIALVSRNTSEASGQLFEVRCAKEEKVPVRGIYISTTDRPATLPQEFNGVLVQSWTWANIKNFIDAL
jgi:hypothetical protein